MCIKSNRRDEVIVMGFMSLGPGNHLRGRGLLRSRRITNFRLETNKKVKIIQSNNLRQKKGD